MTGFIARRPTTVAVIGPLASSDLPQTPARTMAVCAENSDSDVLVMQTADHGMGHDASDPLVVVPENSIR